MKMFVRYIGDVDRDGVEHFLPSRVAFCSKEWAPNFYF